MSRFFRTKTRVAVLPGIALDPNFKCPACGSAEKNVVLFCTRCFNLLPKPERADLRRMVLRRQDVKSKMTRMRDAPPGETGSAVMSVRTFRRGQVLRTTYAGPSRDQMFRLRGPVSSLGDKHGGQWWISWLIGDPKHQSIVLIDTCPCVKPSELKRRGLH